MLVVKELKPGALAEPISYQGVWDSDGLGSDLPAAFWKPIPPSGYVCFGLLVTTGVNFLSPPSTDEIRCVREDLTIGNKSTDMPIKFDPSTLWSTLGTPANVPFITMQVIPKKEKLTEKDAIYVGTFTGSSYTSVYADMNLANWLDKNYVKHVDLDPNMVETLVQRHGPYIWFHPDELCFPDDPKYVLDGLDSNLCWGEVNDLTFDSFSITNSVCIETTADSLIDDFYAIPPNNDPFFKVWIDINDIYTPGNLSRAKALVNVLPVDAIFTDIQFILYFPFNGPGRLDVCASGSNVCTSHHLQISGRHYGDFENVTLRILNESGALVAVYMSRHSQGQWFSRKYFDDTLQFIHDDQYPNPIVYSAKFSHAFYNDAYSQVVYKVTRGVAGGLADLYLWDQTGYGFGFEAYANYEIVHYDIPGVTVQNKPWLDFKGYWGRFEKLSEIIATFYDYTYESVGRGAGPTGLEVKSEWTTGDPNGPNGWYWSFEEE